MKTVKAVFDGQVFVPVTPIKAKKNQVAIITILDDIDYIRENKAYLEYAGALSDDDYTEIADILKADTPIDIIT